VSARVAIAACLRPTGCALMGALVLAPALALAGCGGDDGEATTDAGTGAATTDTSGGTTGRRGSEPPPAERQAGEPRSPTGEDEVPGGPGDEIPARGPADFRGRAGRVGPLVVRVPPFLGIGVTLRSADGRDYGLRIGGKTLRVGGLKRSASATLEGLRPGRSYRGAVLEGGGTVRIEASAEPGP
jgi:hypothetical protein